METIRNPRNRVRVWLATTAAFFTILCGVPELALAGEVTITASYGVGGTITPSGVVTVTPGSSQTFTITPNSGYQISTVLVDGFTVGAPPSYTFTNVTYNHTISATFAQPSVPGVQLLPLDPVAYDVFGYSVAVSGDVAIIGSAGDDDKGLSSGSAYVYRFNGSSWVKEQKLLASDGLAYDSFGYAVAIDGTTAVVTAKDSDVTFGNTGAAYVFRYNGSSWVQEQKLFASDRTGNDFLGISVSISGDVVVIGASHTFEGWKDNSAYVFRRSGSTWVQEQKLLPADSSSNDQFGFSVGVSGTTIVAGAYAKGSSAGSAYIFGWNGSSWIQKQKLVPADSAAYDSFGQGVAISGNLVVIGAWGDDSNGGNLGSAYLYRYNGSTWIQEAELFASDSAANDFFGYSVAVSGEVVVVGAYKDDIYGGGLDTGSAYVFRKTGSTWTPISKLLKPNGKDSDNFGYAVSVSGDRVFVGAAWDDEPLSDSGSAHAFVLTAGCVNGTACNDGLYCNGADTCSGGTCSVHAGNPCSTGSECANICNETVDNCFDPSGTLCTPDTNACTNDVCNGTGMCTHPATPNGGACGDDGISCTSDICSAGICTHPYKVAGSACGSSATSACDNADSCSTTGVCLTNNVANGTACGSATSTDCDNPDTCSNGTCVPNYDLNGTLCTDDGNSCTSDSCNGAGTCAHPAKANGTACNDGLYCNGADSCSAGACSVHVGNPCLGGSECADTCNETADHCFDPINTPCSADTNSCTNDTCNGSGVCTHPYKPAGSACGSSATSACDNADSCNATGVCLANSVANGTACNDNLYCNGADTCSAGACSIHAGNPCPGADGDGNCAESCNETSDNCTAPDPNGSACNDGMYCNGADSCSAGACSIHAGDPCSVTESCDEIANTCDAATVNCDNDGKCESGEDCGTCPGDCILDPGCGDGICEPDRGEDCLSCSADCKGIQSGRTSGKFCCGDGAGVNPLGCSDSRCNASGYSCLSGVTSSCCGDGICEDLEYSCNCPIDCGPAPATEVADVTCNDGIDNDCDGLADLKDSDCPCMGIGAACSSKADCCSMQCSKGKCR